MSFSVFSLVPCLVLIPYSGDSFLMLFLMVPNAVAMDIVTSMSIIEMQKTIIFLFMVFFHPPKNVYYLFLYLMFIVQSWYL